MMRSSIARERVRVRIDPGTTGLKKGGEGSPDGVVM